MEYFPAYDANGNITAYTQLDQQEKQGAGKENNQQTSIAASFDYSPFGSIAKQTVNNSNTDKTEHRFSTKPLHEVSGLTYYKFRHLNSTSGSWISRDPVEEEGGNHLFCFVSNNALTQVDLLGQQATSQQQADENLMKLILWELARGYIDSPHWVELLDNWFWELGPDTFVASGLGDPRIHDISSNPGFQKLVGCWIAQYFRGETVPSSLHWDVTDEYIWWHYTFNRENSAGGAAAYTAATHFLGSYLVQIDDMGSSDTNPEDWRRLRFTLVNTASWESGTRYPSWFQDSPLTGPDGSWITGNPGSLFPSHERRQGNEGIMLQFGPGQYPPTSRTNGSVGGNYSQIFTWEEDKSICWPCDLP